MGGPGPGIAHRVQCGQRQDRQGPPRAESAQLPALHAHLYGDVERRPQLHLSPQAGGGADHGRDRDLFVCESYIYLRYGNVDNKSRAVWEGSTVSWELANDDPVLAANAAGERYTLLALLDADA